MSFNLPSRVFKAKHILSLSVSEMKRIGVTRGEDIAFAFDVDFVNFSRSGPNLVVDSRLGGGLILVDFFAGEDTAALPVFTLRDGTPIESAEFLRALNIDVSPELPSVPAPHPGEFFFDEAASSYVGDLRACDIINVDPGGGSGGYDPILESGNGAAVVFEAAGGEIEFSEMGRAAAACQARREAGISEIPAEAVSEVDALQSVVSSYHSDERENGELNGVFALGRGFEAGAPTGYENGRICADPLVPEGFAVLHLDFGVGDIDLSGVDALLGKTTDGEVHSLIVTGGAAGGFDALPQDGSWICRSNGITVEGLAGAFDHYTYKDTATNRTVEMYVLQEIIKGG